MKLVLTDNGITNTVWLVDDNATTVKLMHIDDLWGDSDDYNDDDGFQQIIAISNRMDALADAPDSIVWAGELEREEYEDLLMFGDEEPIMTREIVTA